MVDFKKIHRDEEMKIKRQEKKQIKEEFVDLGYADNINNILKQKIRNRVDISELPF